MNWIEAVGGGAVIVLVYNFLRGGRQIPPETASEYLKAGALVIDVRTRGEFNAGHLSSAANIPLDEIEAVVPQRVKDKNRVLLLHCQSGARSGMAKGKLSRMGYANVHNLGSYARATKIVKAG